jgi:hypothetical protein
MVDVASLRRKYLTVDPNSPEKTFEEMSELSPFNTIRLQRLLALARYHASIHDHAAAYAIAVDAVGAAAAEYGEMDSEFPGKPGFDQAKFDKEQETIDEVLALDDLAKQIAELYGVLQDAEEAAKDDGKGAVSGGESVEGLGAARPVSTVIT